MATKRRRVYDANHIEAEPLASSQAGLAGEVRIRLQSGEEIAVPQNLLTPDGGGSCQFRGSFADWQRRSKAVESTDGSQGVVEQVVPIAEEAVHVERRPVETGRVRVSRHVTERTERIEEPLLHDTVEVRHVAVNRPIERPVGVRHEGDTTIIPVLEERLVVQKQLVLKEEIHVTRHTTSEKHEEDVVLRSENAVVERMSPGSDGQCRGQKRLPKRQTKTGSSGLAEEVSYEFDRGRTVRRPLNSEERLQ